MSLVAADCNRRCIAIFYRRRKNMAKTNETEKATVPTETNQSTGELLQGSQQTNVRSGGELQHGQENQKSGALQERREGGLARYTRHPFELVQRLSDEMDDLFDSFFYGRPVGRSRGQSRMQNLWSPEVDVREEG